jgi:hypothetical protein
MRVAATKMRFVSVLVGFARRGSAGCSNGLPVGSDAMQKNQDLENGKLEMNKYAHNVWSK